MHLKVKSNNSPYFCKGRPVCSHAGFTLFEILIVLALISLIAGLVVGGGAQMYGSIKFALEKSDIEKTLNDLPFQSFTLRKRIVLGTEPDPQNPDATPPEGVDQQIDSPYLKLPEGWSATVSDPIIYRSDGYCSGGLIKLKSEDHDLTYTLKAPNCAPVLEEKS